MAPPCRCLGHVPAAGKILERGVVGRHQPRARASLDGHVAHCHALFHVQGADGAAGVLQDATRAAADADLRNQRQDDVLGRNTGLQPPIHAHLKGLRLALQQALRGQHMFHFARADSKGQRAKSAVRGGMAVAADHRHAWLRQPQLRPDHMDHALPVAANAETANAEFGAVGFQLRELFGGDLVGDRQRAIGSGDAVIGRSDGEIGTPDLQTALAQALKRLRRRDFMNQMQIDVEQRRSAGLLVNYVRVPEFFDDGTRHKKSGPETGD